MNQYPGIMASKSNFCGLFKKEWTKAVSQRNIVAGFKACGIIPYSPETIPQEAFMPNSIYTLHELVANQPLMEQLDNQPDTNEPQGTSSSEVQSNHVQEVTTDNRYTNERCQRQPGHC